MVNIYSYLASHVESRGIGTRQYMYLDLLGMSAVADVTQPL